MEKPSRVAPMGVGQQTRDGLCPNLARDERRTLQMKVSDLESGWRIWPAEPPSNDAAGRNRSCYSRRLIKTAATPTVTKTSAKAKQQVPPGCRAPPLPSAKAVIMQSILTSRKRGRANVIPRRKRTTAARPQSARRLGPHIQGERRRRAARGCRGVEVENPARPPANAEHVQHVPDGGLGKLAESMVFRTSTHRIPARRAASMPRSESS